MSSGRPFLSFVLPTRNRPRFVSQALRSLAEQTLADIEVIVVDNHTGQSCKKEFDEIADKRFRYVRPEKPLPMHENWELAVESASGRYVSVVIDKTVLRPTAAETLALLYEKRPVDIYTWWADSFVAEDGEFQSTKGEFSPQYLLKRSSPHRFSPRGEIWRRFTYQKGIADEDILYFRGKICFGAYSKTLIERVKRGGRRLFTPINPDFTGTIRGLSYANGAVDLCEPLTVQLLTTVSNGYNLSRDPDYARSFLKTCGFDDEESLNRLPAPGVINSLNNIVGYDYLELRRELDGSGYPSVCRRNLLRCIREEIERSELPKEVKGRYLASCGEIESSCQSCLVVDAAAGLGRLWDSARRLTKAGAIGFGKCVRRVIDKANGNVGRRRLARVVGGQEEAQGLLESKTFFDPVQAARYADECYGRRFELELHETPLFP